ncbi:PepSY domain-containing protein [Pararhizobium haloflavum]|uniref:PepSY domain-containing protein n=1 Tax=Pararhizobium haloflavum TaxID=2037914 RepID=UPI000C19489E|nr:PepSY domain-containing protein [Pararhizobium haloflavum]
MLMTSAASAAAPFPLMAGERPAAVEERVQSAWRAAQSETISIAEAMEKAQERFKGTIIEAAIDAGRPHEKTDVVFELRMLTERGDILKIRIDALDGTILEADGRGLVDARRLP